VNYTDAFQVTRIWYAPLELQPTVIKACLAVLSDDEKQKASSYCFKADSRRYIASRSFLRRLLGTQLGIDPQNIRFQYMPHGKPAITKEQNTEGLEFNLSHSGEIAICALSHNLRVGVDIEIKREVNGWERIAQRYFSEDELDALLNLTPAMRPTAFLRTWTSKEAYVKALGLGLSYPLKEFSMRWSNSRPILVRDRHDPTQVGQWAFHPIALERYTGTVAVESSGIAVKQFAWEW
jgi:4'-phosphopantetheinyl transferase